MENNIIDEFHETPQNIYYASFMRRVGASLLDSLILAPVAFGIAYYSMVHAKSFFLLVLVALISFLYKVVLEKEYGQTLGKRITGIFVLDDSLQKMSYTQSLTRNYYYVLSLILSVFTDYVLIHDQAFLAATTYMEAAGAQAQLSGVYTYISYALGLLFMVDCFMISKSNHNKTLHDKWAKTVVIRSASLPVK